MLTAWITVIAAAASLWSLAPEAPRSLFFGLIVLDPLAQAFRWIALGTIALVLLLSAGSREIDDAWTGETLGLFLFVGVGLMLMAEANHLLMAVVAMELVSLSSYCLVGLTRDARSAEAALKYLLFGALCSGVMLFGVSLLYGATGELAFAMLPRALGALGAAPLTAMTAVLVLLLAGLAFKISMVPFHLWTPDVYEGAPVPVTALLSVGPKAAGLALLLRILAAVQPAWAAAAPAMAWLTVLTMTLGNVVAVAQTNVKRLLAYSTIAQVGYLLIGVVAGGQTGLQAIIVYLTAYLFMNLGAFACVTAVVGQTGSESIDAFRGLAARAPLVAFCTAVFLLSLAGVPPMVGFIGKFLLLGSALQTGHAWLAVAAVVNSAIALYYYVQIIRAMYLAPAGAAGPVTPAPSLRIALALCCVATLGLGLFPGPILDAASRVLGRIPL